MLLAVTLGFAVLLPLCWHLGGPVRALLIAWLVCLGPTALGLVEYDYLVFVGNYYLWVILAATIAYLMGALTMHAMQSGRSASVRGVTIAEDFGRWQGLARPLLAVAWFSILCTVIDVVTGGLDFSDLASIRAGVIEMTSATIWGRLAAITGWACFLSLGYAIYFRSKLGLASTLLYVSGGAGIFLNMLTLAGRNSVLQLIIFCLVIEAVRKVRMRREGDWATGLSARAAVLSAGISYMIYITLNRPGNLDVVDRNAVLLRLFNASLAPGLDAFLDRIPFLKGPIVEFLIYVTHTAPLFSVHLQIDYGGLFYGIFSFPFVARQLEPLHGVSVAAALDLKRFYVESAGVIGFGWTTGLSSFMMDFGFAGCVVLMGLQGALATYVRRRIQAGASFEFVVINALMIISAAFTPFIAAFADTNLFLLMVVLVILIARRRDPPLPVPAAA